jgi:Uncharacterised protein family (UPF0227)
MSPLRSNTHSDDFSLQPFHSSGAFRRLAKNMRLRLLALSYTSVLHTAAFAPLSLQIAACKRAQHSMASFDMTAKREHFVYGYSHGFLSSKGSFKGLELQRRLAPIGIDLQLLDLNLPDGSGAVSYDSGIAALTNFLDQQKLQHADKKVKLRLVGSSLGGYITARSANCNDSCAPHCVHAVF